MSPGVSRRGVQQRRPRGNLLAAYDWSRERLQDMEPVLLPANLDSPGLVF